MSDVFDNGSQVAAPRQLWPRLIADRDDKILRDIRMAVHSIEFSQGWHDDMIPSELIKIIDEVQSLQLLLHRSGKTPRPRPYIVDSHPQSVPPRHRRPTLISRRNLEANRHKEVPIQLFLHSNGSVLLTAWS
ncbi:hypothetical protein PF005_g6756 [Phytophthora fragariae]|uniref:Uncharacterized protein n=1 Tax=Phytophthora fragariae TaxID=53985 RepID=A0A6A3FBP1_9STRA|nr:hypothetical protein PF009_g8400 [Phytophthora fragariae]KAE9020485.1 hypothetical protein PF011_g5393 [Phytophthora fragariae]KAE9122126.1 hypothetical protein PF010_g6851 [Phytophthora fragariae]KAE9124770.1 hypothetical protein PF007_g6592 [Phytophthora fragariae]KAE9149231.1 hypothetical protein PF006_g6263 [Phytophthora fragariae]